jgi:hypothetical protein
MAAHFKDRGLSAQFSEINSFVGKVNTENDPLWADGGDPDDDTRGGVSQ